MEYLICAEQPFDDIDDLLFKSLQEQDLRVERTFSLQSAHALQLSHSSDPGVKQDPAQAAAHPGFSVIMVYQAGPEGAPLGLLIMYEREGSAVVRPLPLGEGYLTRGQDASAPSGIDRELWDKLYPALISSGLEFCLLDVSSNHCIGSGEVGAG